MSQPWSQWCRRFAGELASLVADHLELLNLERRTGGTGAQLLEKLRGPGFRGEAPVARQLYNQVRPDDRDVAIPEGGTSARGRSREGGAASRTDPA